ncbi:MAG: ComEC/Rec2 family competence protein [Synergistaceae bacterium]|nr:ComEC/Rec2 family competence protein [Synergistaceae bacterium]MBQ3448795.1 ComEC/Rec2 family competence protein [Synergistaceae bacterium]MBQ3694675.1 ComEC/Rec2 family competence protein [Synergistaceae bacterium]
MEILRVAPMLGVLASLISALALYDKFGVYTFVIVTPLVYSGLMLCSYERKLKYQWQVFIIGLIFSLLCSCRIYHEVLRPLREPVTLTNAYGTVESIRTWGRGYAAVIDADDFGCYVSWRKFADMMPGSRIKFNGVTRKFKEAKHDGSFDEERYFRARNISGWINISGIEDLPERFSLPLMRYRLSSALTIYMPDRTAKYLKAAWLGERDSELNKKHVKWGTSHLLAVSGFHVGIVILIAGYFFGRNTILLSVILWAYILLTGAAPSALRAGLMLQTGLFARVLKRPVMGVNSVCVAGVMLLLWRPFLFWDIGFRLSLLCALTLTAMFDVRKSLWFAISTIAFLVTFPQIAMTFKTVPLAGIILNLFAPFYFAFAFTISSVCAFLRLMNFPLSEYLMLSCEGIFVIFERLAESIANAFPYLMHWNFLTAWTGTGTLILILCRYFNFSWVKTLMLMTGITLFAFMIFIMI